MARRHDQHRRQLRRERNQRHRVALLADKPCNIVQLRCRVVLHDRDGLVLDMTFDGRLEVGVLGRGRCVRATDVKVRCSWTE